MRKILFLTSLILLVNVVLQCEALQKKLEKKDKTLGVLELVKDSILKAKNYIPECDDKDNETHQNQSLHGKKRKSVAYIDLALELIKQSEMNSSSSDTGYVIEPDKATPDNTTLPKDCFEVQKRGQVQSGIYTIHLFNETAHINRTVDVYCDMDNYGGGWTVIQRRAMQSMQENFDRGWIEYKNGFGSLNGEFWIGNDIIYALTNTGSNKVRFDLFDIEGKSAWESYDYFHVKDEFNGYSLEITNESGSAGDSMKKYSHMQRFSTKDRQNDGTHCPSRQHGGWWYSSNCSMCNPNGLYKPGESGEDTMFWHTWKDYEGLSYIEIKTRSL